MTVTGTGFSSLNLANPAAVKFGSVNAASFTVTSDTRLTAVAPAGTSGSARITVANGTGASTGTLAFAYRTRLGAEFESVTGVKMTGGTVVPVTVTGGTVGGSAKDFSGEKITARVGEAVATVAWVDATHVKVTAPGSKTAAKLPITLLHDGVAGEPSKATIGYAPAATTVSPANITTAGGTSVTITGTGFSEVDVKDPAAVKFGAANATSFTVKSATQIVAVAPAGVNGTAEVTVKTAGGTGRATVDYRSPLGIEVPAGTVAKASGGTVTLKVTGGTAGATQKDFTAEAITARVGDAKATVTWVDATHVRVALPASNAPSAGVTLLHDEVPGAPATVGYVPVVVSLSARSDVVAGGSKVTVKVAGGDVAAAKNFKFGDKAAECTAQGTGSATAYQCVVPVASQPGTTWVSFTSSTGVASRFSVAAIFAYSDLD
ncbi:hypothetical protein GCM10010168_93470 [Actinoplanes ianthinogenes]|uniref:IPT/TIG domain-containing protein n=1 Tax=Actinoplanes ianthinogenes TaxID=122358 RepID=A0ABM7LKI1_9ACTN|nr:hypothetical protein Aiant_04370 [Actinoplanes ianthinogenes]GGR59972.1 hypothetical protein GCM10010168_93470 [Actinoplanes ianthinogenes]